MSDTPMTHSPAATALAVRDPWALVPSLGNLDAYITAVNRVPLLTQEEETAFGRRLRESGDLQAAGSLVVSHLRLVVSISRKYLGYGLPHGDLIQEGNVGLMKAVKRFDPERGVRLASFAIHWIKAEIHEYILRNWRMVKIATTKAQRKLFFNLRSMKTSSATLSPKDVSRMAKALNVKESDVVEMEKRIMGGDVALDPSPEEGEDFSPGSPIAYLADNADGPSEAFERAESATRQTQGLAAALQSLDDRSRRIIQARWLAESDPKTLHELADEFGVSAERIRQIESKAMQKMKKQLAASLN